MLCTGKTLWGIKPVGLGVPIGSVLNTLACQAYQACANGYITFLIGNVDV